MSEVSDQHYLLTQQYNNAQKLEARIQLHRRFSVNTYDWQRWVFEHFTIPPTARVLELGCGPGELWLHNADRIPEGWQVTLTDFSPGMLREIQHNLRNIKHAFAFQQVDAQSIPFEDAHFDAVIANHMLYHVPDRARALAEIRRVLKPEGHFYAATNGARHMRELDELVARFDPDTTILLRAASDISFRLENGADELSQHFCHVALHRYENGLLVTEAQPLVAYVLSTSVANHYDAQKIAQFTAFIEHELSTRGAISIVKETGLFNAS